MVKYLNNTLSVLFAQKTIFNKLNKKHTRVVNEKQLKSYENMVENLQNIKLNKHNFIQICRVVTQKKNSQKNMNNSTIYSIRNYSFIIIQILLLKQTKYL